MKSIQESTIEELAERFLNISRQRVSQLFERYARRNDAEMLRKVAEAKILAKKLRKDRKKAEKQKRLDIHQQKLQNQTIETEKEG